MTNGPDTECEYCHGTGEQFVHSDDCHNDLCALNGDYFSCVGQVIECDCVILARSDQEAA